VVLIKVVRDVGTDEDDLLAIEDFTDECKELVLDDCIVDDEE
jgi:hypothetical protein